MKLFEKTNRWGVLGLSLIAKAQVRQLQLRNLTWTSWVIKIVSSFLSQSGNYFVFHRLLEVRGRLYELLTHCIPPEIIMKVSGPV